MNKNIKLQELKRWLKSSLKNKVSINDKTVIAFLMTGFLGLSTVAQADYVISDGNGSNFKVGMGNITTIRGRTTHNYSRERNLSVTLTEHIGPETDRTRNGETIEKVTLVGIGTRAIGAQAVGVGSNAVAAYQGTALGSDVFATGHSSIAIGNDDISTEYKDTLDDDTIEKIYRDGKTATTSLNDGLSWADFQGRYMGKSGNIDRRVWSPTFARGKGSIAIGSRTVAYADGTTALGTLSFALGDRSTAVGLRAYTHFGADGSTAIGEEARTFAKNTISIGNKTEATSDGSLAFGNLSRAVGNGSIAIGESVASNALLDNNKFELLKNKIDHYTDYNNYKSGNDNKLVDAGFASRQSQKIVSGYINSIVNDVQKFLYQHEGNLVIKTTDDIYKTKKKGDHAISLGYYLLNTGDNTIGIGTASRIHGANSVAIGALNVIDESAANSIAIGVGTRVEKENTLAFGTGALGLGAGSIILGAGAVGTKDNTISIGYGSESKSLGSLAMGSGTKVAENSNASLAIGNNSSIGTKSANATAIGIGAKVANDTQQGMAIGNKAEANLVNSTALGFESRTDYSLTDLSEPGYTPRGSYTIPTSARTGIISVGRIGEERRITNLASGYRDTDAVNVAQLRALEDRFEFSVSGFDDKTINYVSINSDGGDAGRVKEIALREVQYKEYVKLKKLEATLEVRKQSGDNLDQSKVQELFNRIRELENGTNGQRFKNAAIDLIDTIGKIKRTNNNPYFTNGQSGANFKRDDAYAHIDRDEATANNNISSIVSDDERNITKDTNFDNKGAKSADALSIGYKAFVEEGSENSIAIGKESKINKNTTNSVAIGYKASAGVDSNSSVTNAIAIGQESKAQGNYSTVLGYKSQVDNAGGIAIGKEAKTHNSSASAIAIGDKAEVSRGSNSIAIGSGASVKVDSGNANHSVAIGNGSSVTGGYSVAVGKSSKATETGTSAFGENAQATAERATAIGNNSNASGKNAVALAFQALASGENSTALGHRANTSGTNSTALGANSSANIEGGVAIGSHSATTVDKHINGYDPETNATSTNNNATWKSTNAAVSVGHRRNNNEITRQITGVAAGTHDTDAVNVAQLKKLRDAAVIKYFSVNSSQTGNKNNNGAIHNDTVAIGPNAKAEGHNSIAIGHNATTQNGASFAYGYNVAVRGDNSIGIGADINFTEAGGAKPDYTVAIGSSVSIGKHSSYSVAIGRNAKITQVGSVAVGESAKAENDRATSIGNNTSTTVISGIALGYQSVSNRALNDNATTGYDILADGGKSNPDVVWKATHGALSIGASDKTRQITNVAAGRADTDAVNVAQLKQVKLQYRSQNSTGNASAKQSATIAQGLLFKSGSNELKINAKANGEVEFKVELPTSPDNKLTFKAENSTEFERRNSQDKKVNIVSGDFAKSTGTGAATNYKAKNLATELTATGDNATIKIGLKDEVEFTKLSINSGTTQGPTLSTSGIDMGNKNISNLAKGTADNHAVRFDQLKDLDGVTSDKILSKINKGNIVQGDGITIEGTKENRLLGSGNVTIKLDPAIKAKLDNLPTTVADATKAMTFKASLDTTTYTRTNNENKTLTITEGNITGGYVGTNLKTSLTNTGTLSIGLKESPTFKSVAIDGGPTISSAGIAMNNKPITGLGNANNDNDAPTYGQLKNLIGVLESTVTSKVQKGNLVVEDGIEIKDNGSGTNRLIGTGDLKIGLTNATKATLAKVGTGVISTTDPNKVNTVTGEAIQNALNDLTIKYNDGKQGSTAKTSKLSDGLKFVSKSDNLTIEAKDGGSIEFTITDELDKDLTDLTDDGKNVIKNQAIQAVKVVRDTTNTGNPITVTEDDTVANTKTYKIGIDNAKLKAAVGLPTGSVTKDSEDAVTGGNIFNAIKNAKTTVDKKDGEQFITVEKTEPEDSIQANSYKIGLNITPLSTELAKSFAKKDASNITEAGDKTAWRNALDVYNKSEVDTNVKAATEKVVDDGNNIVTVTEAAGQNGLGKTFTVGLTAEKVKEVAGTSSLGTLSVENDLALDGNGTNRLVGAGNLKITLSEATKAALAKIGVGVISEDHADKDKTVTGKAVFDYINANVNEKAITFKASDNSQTKNQTGFVRKNGEDATVSIIQGNLDNNAYKGDNLKTSIDGNGTITIGLKASPMFDSLVVGTNADDSKNININNNGIDLKEKGITGLTKGKAGNEAVNVDQLSPLATALGTSVNAGTGEVAAPSFTINNGKSTANPNGNFNTVGGALTALDDAISNQEIKYNDGGSNAAKSVKLKDGLNFKSTNDLLTVKANDNGEITLTINSPNTANNSISFAAETGDTYSRNNSENKTIEIVSGKASDETVGDNLATKIVKDDQDENKAKILIGLKKEVSFDKVTINNNGPILAASGLDMNSKGISNLAKGKNANDAINLSQLTPFATALGGGAAIDASGDLTAPTYALKGGNENATNYSNVGDGLKALDNAITAIKDAELSDKGKEAVKDLARDAVKVAVNEEQKDNPITVKTVKTDAENTTYKIGIDIEKIKEKGGLSGGEVADNETKTVTGDKVFDAITNAKTKVDLKTGENYLTLEKVEPNGINPNKYTIGLKLTELTTKLGETFAKKDASNITEAGDKTAWRNALDVYNKSHVDNLELKYNVVGNPQTAAKSTKLSDGIKFKSTSDKLTLKANDGGEIELGLNLPTNIPENVADGTKSLTVKASINTPDTGYVKTNNEDKSISIIEGDITDGSTNYKGTNLKTSIDENGVIKIGLKENALFASIAATESISVTGGATITKDGINLANDKITNLAKGTNNDDAVNKAQLEDLASKIGGGTTVSATGDITGPTFKLKAGQVQPTEANQPAVTSDYNTVADALKALDDAIENVKNAEFTDKGKEDVKNLAREAVKVKAKPGDDNAITVNPIKTPTENTTYELFVEKTDSIAANAGTPKDPAPADQDENPNHPNRLVTEKAVVDYVATKVTPVANNKLTFGADNTDTFERKNSEDKAVSIKATNDAITVGTSTDKYLGNNLTTKLVAAQDGKSAEILIGLKESPQFKDVFATEKIAIGTPTQSGPALTKDGIDGGNKPVFNVAKGVNNDDVITVSQLKPLLDRLGATLKTDGTDDNGQKDQNGTVTAPTFDLKTGAQAPDTTKAYGTVGDALKALDEKLSKTATGTSSLTFSDGNATNNFVRENNEDKTIEIKNADNDKNITVALSKTDTTGTFKVGLASDLKGITSITNGDGTNPDTKSKITLANDSVKVSVQGKDLTIAKSGEQGKEGISITGLEERDIDSDNYGIDNSDNNGVNNKTRAATEGAVKHLSDVLGANITIVNKIGPAGKDGLDGKSIVEKVEGLRDGQSGPIVYTDENGKRLVKDPKDGKYYVMKEDGTKDENQEVNPENVRLSMVDPSGETTKPITIGNIASALGLDKEKPNNGGAYDKPINETDAKDVIGGLLTKDTDLNRAVTLADLQALAVAGLDFTGNTTLDGAQNVENKTTRRKLSEKLTIIGKENVDSFDTYSTDNLATRVSEGKIEIGMLKKPTFEGLRLTNGKDGQDGKTFEINPTDTGIEFKKQPADDNGNTDVIISGVKPGDTPNSVATKGEILEIIKEIGGIGKDGKDGVDGRDGSKGLDGKDTENFGPAGKDGLNGQPIHERVNALRRGEAGPVVYTDPEGNRLIKGYDGKLYKQQDLVDKVYVENVGFIPKGEAEQKEDGTYMVKANVTPTVTNPFALTEHADKVKHSLVNIDGTTTKPSKLSNLAEGEISATSKDAINGSQLFSLKETLGLNDDKGSKDGTHGPAGKDGLNGTSILDKVKGLRDGSAGNTVYTLPNGDRVVRGEDGKLYRPDDIKDKVYVEGKGYVPEADKDSDTAVAATPLSEDEEEKVVISAVNPDGTTTKPTGIANVASGLGLNGKNAEGEDYNKPITAAEAKNVVAGANGQGGLLAQNSDQELNKVATVRDLQALAQAGLDFKGNVGGNNEDKTTHRTLASTLEIVGTDAQIDDFDKSHSTVNVATKVSEGKIEIGFKKSPEFEALKLKNLAAGNDNKVITLTPNEEGNKLTISGPGNKPVELDGIAPGKSPNSAVNKAQLDELANKLGDVTKDGTDGRNGAKGLDGQDAPQGDVGPAGKDGLNGKDLNEKVNALRRGEAGPVVYTDKEGNRLVKGLDGKLYKLDDIKDKVYVEGTGYVNESETTKDHDGTITANQGATPATAIDPGNNNENIRLAGVNIDGSTDKPTLLTNIASGLDPEKIGKDAAAIMPDAAKKIVGGDPADQNDTGLLGLTDKAKLNTVATVGDLQALAQAGLDFAANSGNELHRPLSTKLSITGNKDNEYTEEKYSLDNVATTTDPTNYAIRVGFAKVPRFDAIELGEKPKNPADPDNKIVITPNPGKGEITFKNEPGVSDPNGGNPDDKVVIKGVKDGDTDDSVVTKGKVDKIIQEIGIIGKDGKDGRDGSKSLDGKDAKDYGAAGKDGLNGESLLEKVNALRRGEAGPVVYTDHEGNRLIKGHDGKLYKQEDLKGKVYIEHEDGTNGYVSKDKATLQKDGTYKLNENETPTYTDAFALTEHESKVKHSLVNIDGTTTKPSKLSNVADGEISSTSTDAINGSQLFALAGNVAKDGTDGRNGINGLDGKNADSKDAGLSGKDGLNGVSVNEKANALRRGEAGPVVFTKEDGTRLAKANDGKLYNKENVTAAGDLVKDNYVKVIDPTTKEATYYNKDSIDENGILKKDATPLNGDEKTAAETAFNDVEATDADKVVHSLANIDGTTTNPSTLRNVASGLDASKIGTKDEVLNEDLAKKLIGGDSASNMTGLLEIAEKEKLNRVATIGDLQALAIAGLDFEGNVKKEANGSNITHRKLSQKLQIIGKEGVNSFDDYSVDNIATRVSEGKVEIGILKKPVFEAIKLKGDKANSPTFEMKPTDNGIKLSKDPAGPNNDDKVVITGLKDGDTEDSAVTKGTIDKIIEKIGTVAKDGEDGRNGANGLDGEAAENKDAGAAGKDGLNGKDLNEKVNALRRGEAGTVIYTDKEGNRLVKGFDGKLYTPNSIKDKVFVEGVGYVDKNNATEGENGKYTLNAGIDANNVEKANSFDTGENNENVRLSAVNIDGTTTAPTTLGNIASGIDPAKIGKEDKAIEKSDAIKAVENLLKVDKANNLNTAATVGDIQAIAKAGLEFVGNDGEVHRELGTKLSIVGEDKEDGKTYSTKNITTEAKVEGDITKIEIKIAEKPVFKGLELVTTPTDPNEKPTSIKFDPTKDGINLSKDPAGADNDNKVVITGLKDGDTEDSAVTKGTVDKIIEKIGTVAKDGEDGRNGVNGLDGEAAENKDAGAAGKDGLNGKDLNEKVNALRRGEAGPVVYTDKEGNRLVKGHDGKLYKPADIENKVFVKNLGYVDENLTTKGEDGTYSLTDPNSADTVAKATPIDLGENNENVIHSLVNIDGTTTTPSKLSNVADGEISETSTDAINGSQLYKATGNVAKDGIDGRNGSKGLDGRDAVDGKEGAAGKDGLNGKDLNEKTNALRRGEAGTVVYTDLDGNRLVKGLDGKLYKPEDINEKVFVDGVGYVSKDDAKEKADGSGYELKDTVSADTVAKVDSFNPGANNENVRLSAVNIDGRTTAPTTLGNIASGIDPTKIGKEDKAIEKDDAKAAVEKLLEVNKADKLNTVATVGDVQALAQAGLTFKGNKNTDIHRPLGTILTIKGEGTGTGDNFESASGNILVDNNEAGDGLEIKLSKALSNLRSISFDKEDPNAGVITGLKDLDENSDGSSAANKNYVDEKLAVAKDASSGIANAIAMSNLTQVQHRGGYRHQISAGYGTYNGEHAFGLGLSGISKGGQVMYKASGSLNTRGKFAAGVGVGYQFDKEEIIEDEVVVNLKNEVKKSQDETNMLKAKLNENNKEIQELKETLSKLVKQVSDNYQELKQDLYMVNAYEVNSYTLSERQERELKAIIEDLNTNHKNKIIDVTGFADITSNEKYNLEIGLNRARYVAEKLIEFGLDESILIRKVNSQGHNQIVETNENAQGRLANRRVEISVK